MIFARLEMDLVTTFEMRFALVCIGFKVFWNFYLLFFRF